MTAAWPAWVICIAATAGVITRPFRWPEAIWGVTGAMLLVLLGLMPVASALGAIAKGTDVYLFLTGMMLLSETARVEGLFDWVAATAVNRAHGSSARLFALVYGAGVVVTTLLSNDATAVVLTPAVYVAARKGGAEPLPLLFACALVANAASFVLPISNPANLVLYGGHMPPLGAWLRSFALPSLASIAVTFFVLKLVERQRLVGPCALNVDRPALTRGGWAALFGIVATALLLIVMSALDQPLGLPTCIAGVATAFGVSIMARRSPAKLVGAIAWSVLPLVAGLFVLVEALDRTGVVGSIAGALGRAVENSEPLAAAGAGTILAFGSNLVNNLPAGLIASTAIEQAHTPRLVMDGLLIGVDLGPNLSVTGSLATILWLAVIRREGENVGFWQFMKIGAVTMPPALIAAMGARLLIG
ncbi:arsenic transporter [Sphingomonas oligophenolica]|uniref:Arsenic transporter n=1 Tax=Sphingomonas oligophenolica TaxID=301154 RepID=A0A502C742_9SPHN|nr:arsenic transporter [Sphingomonas oligophenolica]TPG07516.1 arsenic transporter [Sphingomonas oligophenolica]